MGIVKKKMKVFSGRLFSYQRDAVYYYGPGHLSGEGKGLIKWEGRGFKSGDYVEVGIWPEGSQIVWKINDSSFVRYTMNRLKDPRS